MPPPPPPRVPPWPRRDLSSLLLLSSFLLFASSSSGIGASVASAASASLPPSTNDDDDDELMSHLHSLTTTYASTKSSSGMMFDVSAKDSAVATYGLEINVANDGSPMRVLAYTKMGTHVGHEYDESLWKVWMNVTVKRPGGLDGPTYVPQHLLDDGDSSAGLDLRHLDIPPRTTRAFYVTVEDGPYLRHSDIVDDTSRLYYQDVNVVVEGSTGSAKKAGWDGVVMPSRTFSGGIHYYLEDDGSAGDGKDIGENSALLPGIGLVTPSPTDDPTSVPTESPTTTSPTTSTMPSSSPTESPTGSPTESPTEHPSSSPIDYDYLSTYFEVDDDGNDGSRVLTSAGHMFDIKARSDVEISAIGINTYLKTPLMVMLYVREGSHVGHEDDMDGWTMIANVTVDGMGMGEPTYIPYGSFEPIALTKGGKTTTTGMYVTTDGPHLVASEGTGEARTPHASNTDLVMTEGVGKRYPMDYGTLNSRAINVVLRYERLYAPTFAPTIDVSDLWVANSTFVPIADAYVDRDVPDGTFGKETRLMVDGRTSEKVTLMQFDLGILNGQTKDAPSQVLRATLRLYSMDSRAMFGGYVAVIPNGEIDEATASWNTVPYGDVNGGTYVGRFRSVWPEKFYEIDITMAFRGRNTIPRGVLVRISSDQDDGVAYRSKDSDDDGTGTHPRGPRLTIDFAYQPDTNKALARSFGSDPPTMAPTVLPEWKNAKVPSDLTSDYFNYNPETFFGPDKWENVEGDGWYDQLSGLDIDTRRNRCADGSRQSPRDLCATNDKCIEWHEPRPRVGMYGLRDESWYRPTPLIMHNKLRLSYPQRRSENEMPEPPGTDFAHNVYKSGIQDLVHIDIKVRSEHRLCGKQYDGEMQLFHVQKSENDLEAMSILIEAGGKVEGELGYEDNPHFQILLDFFQRKFDLDARSCARKRRRRARTLFESLGKDEDGKTRRAATYLRARSSSSTVDEEDQYEGSTDRHDETTLGSALHRKILEKFRSLVPHRRDATLDRWAPLEPLYIYNSIHFWAYSGSLTEPPCSQGVHWRVIDVPMRISMKQYIQLKTLMFDHVDPDTCRKTSTHFEESNARPVQPWTEGGVYRCRRSDYMSDMEREISGSKHGFRDEELWMGVDNLPYVTPEFPDAG